jgi:membrane-bound lytic murein transglycosylase A
MIYRLAVLLLLLSALQACTGWLAEPEPEPGIGPPVSWEKLEGWRSDRHAEAWPALLESCTRLSGQAGWKDICRDARRLDSPSDAEARAFFESRFRPHPVTADDGGRTGLVTGYYEPLLRGSLEPGGRYSVPLYGPPDDLLTIDLDEVAPELDDRRLRGRLQGRTVTPYPSRAEITSDPGALSGTELLWLDDEVDAFFLHVQGSGRVRLPDGRVVAARFADHNGHPYRSIGRRLIETGELERDQVNLFTIRTWLREHPGQLREVLNHNPRFVFFSLDDEPAEGPRGALNVPLTPGRSLAVDRDRIDLGVPVWLDTSMPGEPGTPLRRLMLAQDTGGAIQGWLRADVFWGLGRDAERKAGLMKEQGRMFVLLPGDAQPPPEG